MLDKDDFRLHSEQQFEFYKEQLKNLTDLKKSVDKLIEIYKAPVDELVVSGEVKVNTEKEVSVSNLEAIQDWLNDLGQELSETIKNHSYEPLNELTIKNIAEAKADKVSITNLKELKDSFDYLAKVIIDNQPIVNVQKQEIKFPNTAKDAIPVRLSDGKAFYKAMAVLSQAGTKADDPLAGYQVTDEATVGTAKYYGFSNLKGDWYIMRSDSGAYRYAKGSPQPNGGGLYIDAWTNKANLEYDYIFNVFR